MDKIKLKLNLESKLKRPLKENEIVNMEKDALLLAELALEEIEEIKKVLVKNNIK